MSIENDDFLARVRARAGQPNRSGAVRAIVGTGLLAFLLGVAGTGYFAWRSGADFGFGSGDEPAALLASGKSAGPSPNAGASDAAAAVEAAEVVEKVAEQQGGLEQRVVAMEQRLDQLYLQSEAAAGNSARAEGLLIAFATRRAIERGAPLGYLSDQLKLRFADAQPKAVTTVIEAAQNPVTLDKLLARLDGLAPSLAVAPAEEGGWSRFTRELGELFVIRRESAPSPQPERRLERARLFLETGRTEAAIGEIRNMPGAADARAWIADAERYSAAQQALDLLETTAVLEPRNLRDRDGNRIEQPSPAASSTASQVP